MGDKAKESIGAERHVPTQNFSEINRVIEKANKDPEFIDFVVNKLAGLRFPAYKHTIIEFARNIDPSDDVITLFESLDGYIEFHDQYHVQKALEENVSVKKKQYQMTDEKREHPDVRTRPTNADAGIKESEAVNSKEERKDYPEVTPTAMSNFVCDRCGKPFQNPDDLVRHKRFESGGVVT